MEFEGGDALSNLTVLNNSFEPRSCSTGDEQYTVIDSRTVKLSHFLVTCTAEISLAAQVHTGHNITYFSALHDNSVFVASRYKCCVWRKYHHSCCIK